MTSADRAYEAWMDARCDGDLVRAGRWALVVLRELVAGRPPAWGPESAPHFAEKLVSAETRYANRNDRRNTMRTMAEIMAELTSELAARLAVPRSNPLWTTAHWHNWLHAVIEGDADDAMAAGVALLHARDRGDRMPWSNGARDVFEAWCVRHAATIRGWRDEVLAPESRGTGGEVRE